MLLLPFGLVSLCFQNVFAAPSQINRRAAPSAGYYDPTDRNGSMLTFVTDTYPRGLGEPLNVILSGNSDPEVLPQGSYFLTWIGSLGFSQNCLGQISESQQQANLGDGKGQYNETGILRWNYGDYSFGSCKETIDGGNHFRYWVQDGSEANSGAVFMAASVEENLANGHDIESPDGYDAGRDQLVGNATQSGGTSFLGVTFEATYTNVTGLLQKGSSGINHGLSIDGVVKVLTVKITNITQNYESSSAIPQTSGLDHRLILITLFLLCIGIHLF